MALKMSTIFHLIEEERKDYEQQSLTLCNSKEASRRIQEAYPEFDDYYIHQERQFKVFQWVISDPLGAIPRTFNKILNKHKNSS